MHIVWDLQGTHRIDGVRYGRGPTDFSVYTSSSTSGPWTLVFDNEGAGDEAANEQTFMFLAEATARYWKVVILAPLCTVVDYWQWHAA
jgi:hypothetical protein